MWAEDVRMIPALREASLKTRHCPCWPVSDPGERRHPSHRSPGTSSGWGVLSLCTSVSGSGGDISRPGNLGRPGLGGPGLR